MLSTVEVTSRELFFLCAASFVRSFFRPYLSYPSCFRGSIKRGQTRDHPYSLSFICTTTISHSLLSSCLCCLSQARLVRPQPLYKPFLSTARPPTRPQTSRSRTVIPAIPSFPSSPRPHHPTRFHSSRRLSPSRLDSSRRRCRTRC